MARSVLAKTPPKPRGRFLLGAVKLGYDEQKGEAGEGPELPPERHPRVCCHDCGLSHRCVCLPGADADVPMVTVQRAVIIS